MRTHRFSGIRFGASAVLLALAACAGEGREVLAHYEGGALHVRAHERRNEEGVWVKAGLFEELYESGTPRASGSFRGGARAGFWTRWHPDGSEESRGSFLFGEKEGVWVHHDVDGKVDQELTGIYEADRKVAEWFVDGRVTEWYDSGQPKDRNTYVDGVRDGPSLSWYADGTKRYEGRFARGRKEGRWTYWHADGSVDGERTGVYDGWKKVGD